MIDIQALLVAVPGMAGLLFLGAIIRWLFIDSRRADKEITAAMWQASADRALRQNLKPDTTTPSAGGFTPAPPARLGLIRFQDIYPGLPFGDTSSQPAAKVCRYCGAAITNQPCPQCGGTGHESP